MGKIVSLANVQNAIQQLRDNGEKVSRRNVLAITGGGMSTVHRMMSEIEDLEAQQALKLDMLISPVLQIAIKNEISSVVKKATIVLQDQVKSLQEREREALDALAKLEIKSDSLSIEMETLKQQSERERTNAEKNQMTATATIAFLENALKTREIEKQELQERLEAARINETRALLRCELLNKDNFNALKKLE